MTLTESLIYILTSSFVIQIIYIIIFHSRVTFHKNQTLNQSFGVSISHDLSFGISTMPLITVLAYSA